MRYEKYLNWLSTFLAWPWRNPVFLKVAVTLKKAAFVHSLCVFELYSFSCSAHEQWSTEQDAEWFRRCCSQLWLYLTSVIYLWTAILPLLQFLPQLYFCPVSIENSFYQIFSSLATVTLAWCKCRSSRESLAGDEVWWTLTLLGSLNI